jgi:hypothetical protein
MGGCAVTARGNRNVHWGFRRLCAGLAIAAVTLGLLSAAPGGAAAQPAGSGGARLSVRLSLGGGRGRPAAVATLGVPTAGVYKLQASLNGQPVALPPLTGTGARRVLNLAQLGRLRFGANRLRVRLVMNDGAVQVVRLTFTLSSRRNIVAARALAPATVGHTVILDARRSLLVPGTGGLATARWALVRRPAGSHARLGSATGPRVWLHPDVPGNYVVALRVGTGRATGVDLLNVDATPPGALIPFNTIAPDPANPANIGIRIAGTFYADPKLSALQVLVLQRKDLSLVSNSGYAADAQGIADMNTFLQSLNANQMVIVTHPGTEVSPPITDPSLLDNLNKAVGMIGGNLGAPWGFGGPGSSSACGSGFTGYCFQDGTSWHGGKLYGGSFSIIGVPKMPAGQAWRETAVQNGDTDGRITGYFTKGTIGGGYDGNFTVVSGPDPDVPVQTCVANTSDPDECAVTVGDSTTGVHTYSRNPAVSNGMHVVVLNRTTLAPIINTTVTTVSQLLNAVSTLNEPVVGHYIVPGVRPLIDDQRIAIIQSIGNGQLTGSASPQLFLDINQLGGTPDYLWDAIHNGCRYALVGAAADLPWQGTAAESSTAMRNGNESTDCHTAADGAPTGLLDGMLERDRVGLYTPLGADPAGATNNALLPIIYQKAQPWPYADDAVGLRYIADYVGLCTQGVNPCQYADVRSAYTNENIPFDPKYSKILTVTCTGGVDVCGPDFDALADELTNEFLWVIDVRNFADNLIKPYQQEDPNKQLNNVTKAVVNSVKDVPQNTNITMSWLTIVKGLMTIGKKVAELLGESTAAKVMGLAANVATAASGLTNQANGAPGGDSVTAVASGLSDQINTQVQNYIKWVNVLPDILSADYGKLSTVGPDLEHNTNDEWGWNGGVTDMVTNSLDAETRASAYSGLLPAAWEGVNLIPGTGNPPDPNDVTKFHCAQVVHNIGGDHIEDPAPFANALEANQFHSLTSINVNTGAEIRQVWTFASNVDFADGKAPSATVPVDNLTSNIYGPQATDTANGAYQYEASWWRSTYNPPSHVGCNHTPIPVGLPQPYSKAYPPPSDNIGSPPP